MTTTLHDQAGKPSAPAWSASGWLRVGQAVLFVGLLGLAALLAVARGAGWPVGALGGAVRAAYGGGLRHYGRHGPARRWL